MKSQDIKRLVFKTIFIFIAVCCIYLTHPGEASAFIPEVHVRVINSVTGAPISGVWVRQKNTGHGTNPGWSSFLNDCNGVAATAPINGRYVQTDTNGSANFQDPEQINQSVCNQQVDTNKDGTPDEVSFPCTGGYKYVNGLPTTSCTAFGEFSCYGNPMLFEVVKPVGDAGTYTSVSNVTVPNAAADLELTIYYTPAGATPAPTPSPNPITEATKKEIGTLTSIGQKFQPLKQIEEGKDYWVRIQVFNGGRSYSKIRLKEVINSEYFQLYQPSYIDAYNSNFFIETYRPHGYSFEMEDRTYDECPDAGAGSLPNCISGYISGGNTFTASQWPFIDGLNNTSNPQKYFYFKVKAIKNSNGNPVKVDVDDVYPAHTGSYVDYVDLPNTEENEPGLDNEEVVICPVGGCINSALGYVQILLGNVYSHYMGIETPITFELPLNTALIPEPISTRKTSILFQRDPDPGDYGAGRPVDSQWYLQNYAEKVGDFNYNNLYQEYQNKPIQSRNISGVNQLDSGVGYYIDQGSVTSGRYTISGGGWKNQTINNQQAVIFVPGDLYINENIEINSEGNSSLAFIVQGNVGIDPTVTNVEGIFIVDGVIDTTCSASNGFSAGKCQSTVTPPDVRVTLEGLYYSNGGFVLDRNTGTEPSETFRFRPDFLFSASNTLGKNLYSWTENPN